MTLRPRPETGARRSITPIMLFIIIITIVVITIVVTIAVIAVADHIRSCARSSPLPSLCQRSRPAAANRPARGQARDRHQTLENLSFNPTYNRSIKVFSMRLSI
jgi:hypothetical protein